MRTLFLVFFVFCLTSFNHAQVVGKIFDKDFANKEFGEVLNTIEVNNENLSTMLKSSGEYIMFNINSGKLRAIDQNRKSVKGLALYSGEVFYSYSTSQVELLLEKGGEKTTKIEMRPKTLTLTNGKFTLERSDPCPPECP